MSDSFDLFLDKVGVDDKFWQFWPFCFIEKDNLDDKFRERERERERERCCKCGRKEEEETRLNFMTCHDLQLWHHELLHFRNTIFNRCCDFETRQP